MKKTKPHSGKSGPAAKTSTTGVIPAAALKSGGVAALEQGATTAAQKITPSQALLLLWQLIFALWLLGLKVTLRRGKIAPFLARLAKVMPSLPSPRELNLWIRLVLHALEKYGFLPTHDFKHYRRQPHLLATVTHAQVKQIADDYVSLRALQREFEPSKNKPPEQVLLELLISARKRIEETPEAVTDAVKAEINSLREQIASGTSGSGKARRISARKNKISAPQTGNGVPVKRHKQKSN